jgi:hypothetical protein
MWIITRTRTSARATIRVIDWVPPEMQAIKHKIVWDAQFYTRSFRKPVSTHPADTFDTHQAEHKQPVF